MVLHLKLSRARAGIEATLPLELQWQHTWLFNKASVYKALQYRFNHYGFDEAIVEVKQTYGPLSHCS